MQQSKNVKKSRSLDFEEKNVKNVKKNVKLMVTSKILETTQSVSEL